MDQRVVNARVGVELEASVGARDGQQWPGVDQTPPVILLTVARVSVQAHCLTKGTKAFELVAVGKRSYTAGAVGLKNTWYQLYSNYVFVNYMYVDSYFIPVRVFMYVLSFVLKDREVVYLYDI